MEVGWDPVLVTVTFLDQWRSVGLVFQGGFKVVSWFLVGSHGFQGGFIVFHGFWLVSMVFQGSSWFFIVFGLFPWFFKIVSWFLWF